MGNLLCAVVPDLPIAVASPAIQLTSLIWIKPRIADKRTNRRRPRNCVMFSAGGFGYFLTVSKYSSTALSAGPVPNAKERRTCRLYQLWV